MKTLIWLLDRKPAVREGKLVSSKRVAGSTLHGCLRLLGHPVSCEGRGLALGAEPP